MPKDSRPLYQRGLSLQVLVLIIVPLTVLLTVIAVGSIAIHEQAMRLSQAEGAPQAAPDWTLQVTLVAPLVLLAPVLFALAALWFGAKQIVQPLQRLEKNAAAVAAGDYDAIQESVGGISEVQHLRAELAEMARKVRASQAALHDYIGAITSAQEEERNRLAHELHDDTIQAVIALKQRVQFAQQSANTPGTQQALDELEALAEDTVKNLRRLTHDLRPIYLEDLGLVTALEMLTRETSQPDVLRIDFERKGLERRLPRGTELALYRIAQQALNNVVRHSQARHAALHVSFLENEVTLDISDDGIGFQVPNGLTDLAPSGHYGLLGMRERADLIGAQFELESAPGKGTKIRVRL
jgi:two-component system sensor histidine kinase UhpB